MDRLVNRRRQRREEWSRARRRKQKLRRRAKLKLQGSRPHEADVEGNFVEHIVYTSDIAKTAYTVSNGSASFNPYVLLDGNYRPQRPAAFGYDQRSAFTLALICLTTSPSVCRTKSLALRTVVQIRKRPCHA